MERSLWRLIDFLPPANRSVPLGYVGTSDVASVYFTSNNVTITRLLYRYSITLITAPFEMIHGVVYSEFDNDAGPQIVFQAPEKYVLGYI